MSNKRHYEFFLSDIVVANAKIKHIVSRHDNADSLLFHFADWDSVIREFTIIGEATKRLIDVNLLETSNRLPIDFRNKIVHEYFGIDPEVVWETIREDLPYFMDTVYVKISEMPKPFLDELIEAAVEENVLWNFIVQEIKTLRQIK
jgi:uncharacterized protein with HEPN domain